MTAAEKRKYVAAKLLESIAPYGYFLRYGAIWKYSMDGKYVVCISFHLGRMGNLIDIYIGFGSFFAPLEINEYVKHCLALSSMGLAYYVRNAGLGSPLLDINLTFEEQVASILPYFQNIIFPCLPKNDDLNDYMHKAEQFMHLSTTAFDGVPYYVDIKEVAYAYLSLNHPEEALRAVSQYAEQCRYAANEIATHADYYRYENEKAVARWNKASQEALSFKEAISSGGRDLFEAEMAQREQTSADLCRKFFHIPNSK